MRFIEGNNYFTSGDVGAYVNRNVQTINNWDKYSDTLESRGEPRLIPKPIRINGQRLFTPNQVKEIKHFADNIKRGQLTEFNRKRLGTRGKEIEKRVKAREKEQERKQEEKKEKELEVALSKVNRAVDFKDRFKRLKKDL